MYFPNYTQIHLHVIKTFKSIIYERRSKVVLTKANNCSYCNNNEKENGNAHEIPSESLQFRKLSHNNKAFFLRLLTLRFVCQKANLSVKSMVLIYMF